MLNQEEENFFNEIQKQKQEIENLKMERLRSMPESQFECNKCHKRQVNYDSKAIRRHDEPGVVGFTCTLCKATWKQR